MNGQKTYRRIIPVSDYDIAGMETWLSNMAEKGLFLYDLGFFTAKFTKGEPKPVRYRLEPSGEDTAYPDLDQKYLYEDSGWRFVSAYKKLFYVFTAEEPDAPELHTDPLLQSQTLKKLSRLLTLQAATCAAAISIPLVTEVLLPGANSWVYDLLMGVNALRLWLIPPSLILCLYLAISAVRLYKLRRRLRAGLPFEHGRKKPATGLKILEFVGLGVVLLLLLASIVNLARPNYNYFPPLSEAPDNIPVLSLADIDAELYKDYQGGHFEIDHSLLVPDQFTVWQNIQAAGMSHIESVLHTYYYRAVFPWLAERLYREILQSPAIHVHGMTIRYEHRDYEPLDTVLFDAAAYARVQNGPYSLHPDGSTQYLIAYRGNTVVIVTYEGGEDLRDKLDVIADTFWGKAGGTQEEAADGGT